MSILQELTQALHLAYTNQNYTTVLELAPELLIELSKNNLLSAEKSKEIPSSDLAIVNKILEVICNSSLLAGEADDEIFSKYISLIKPSSENIDLLWLHLISLLSQGNFVEHQQLSTYYHIMIPNFEKGKYASFGKNLEVFLSEGNYGGVLKSFQQESEIDKFILSFKNKFLRLCRDEIGDNLESSYKNGLKLGAARTLLYFSTDLEVASFVEERGWNTSSNGIITFHSDGEHVPASRVYADEDVDTVEMVLSYAQDVERVI